MKKIRIILAFGLNITNKFSHASFCDWHVPSHNAHDDPEVNVTGNFFKNISLDGTWKVKDFDPGEGVEKKVYSIAFDKSDFLPAPVPGTARQALLLSGKIPDPYFGFNNEESLWVETREWWFCREFEISHSEKGKYIDLCFSGTVFKGEVWLNGHLLGELEGMFNPVSFPVSEYLDFEDKNHLAVRLEAPEDARNIEKWNGLTFDSRRKQLYSIAQCLFAWDWAPHMVPVGIWQSVNLRITGPLRLEFPKISTKIESEKRARVTINLVLKNLSEKKFEFKIQGNIRGKNFSGKDIAFHLTGAISSKETIHISHTLVIENPKLWWPNGMGDPNLYVADIAVGIDNSISDKTTVQFGIRELRMVDNDDIETFVESMKNEVGNVYRMGKVIGSYPWTFEINGVKIFAKGANWIPADQMLRLGKDRYERLLRLARDAHFNVLRIWGGGLYETDDFYNLCDEFGILAWQEFLSNRNFSNINKENFLSGAKATIYRIRNHPSLAFYCGGNEFDPDDEGSKIIIDSLEKLIKELDPEKEFHRASPYMGDDHHWGVWHGKEPYTCYRQVRPFRSEAGVNTFPVVENYRKFTPEQLLWPPDQTYIEYHGENATRFHHLNKLQRYANEFGESNSIEEFINKSQLYQGLANAFNMEFCRANKFKNSGLLYWQYNDSWPCISWSLVDWYGTPKPGYYFSKRASRPLHVSIDFKKYLWNAGENFQAEIFLLNDKKDAAGICQIRAALFDISGNSLTDFSWETEAKANTSAPVGEINWQIPQNFNGRTLFATAILETPDGERISEAVYPIAVSKNQIPEEIPLDEKYFADIFSEMKNLPKIKLNISGNELLNDEIEGQKIARLTIENPSPHLAFFVHLKPENEDLLSVLYFSDNYFALLPGEKKKIEVSILGIQAKDFTSPKKLIISGWNVEASHVVIEL